jgi:hypothetical protein
VFKTGSDLISVGPRGRVQSLGEREQANRAFERGKAAFDKARQQAEDTL